MQKEDALREGLMLVASSKIAMLGTIDEQGYPNVKALIKMENEGLKRIWFTTNKSSKRVSQLMRNPKSCVYFVDLDQRRGLMLTGTTHIITDSQSKRRF